MRRVRKFTAAAVVAGTIACGMVLMPARVEAKKPGGGEDGQGAICAYLMSVITYPNVNAYIKASAMSLYTAYGCLPVLP